MSTRIKICYEDDIRMFKSKSKDEKELLNGIAQFVKDSYKVSDFRLSFKDEEGDEITIVDEDDLHEALQSSKQTAKIFVKTSLKKSSKVTTPDNDDDDEQESEDEVGETYNDTSDDENEEPNDNFRPNCHVYLKFLDDLAEDKELKKEFVGFLRTFLLSLQKNNNNSNEGVNGSELFVQALSMYNKLNKHEVMNKFVTEKLDILFYQFPHLLNILKTINVNEIEKFLDLIIDFHNNNKNSPRIDHFPMLPPFLFPFLRLFNYEGRNTNEGNDIPPFGLGPSFFNIFGGRGGCHRGRGRHCGFGGRHRGRHHGFGHRHGHGHGHKHRHGHHGHHGMKRNEHCKRGRGMRHGHGFFNHPIFGGMNNNGFNNHGKFRKHKDLRADIIDENITLGKNAIVASNRTLIKTWKMKNVGKKPIPENISIQYFGRKFNPMIDGHKFELNNKEININEEFEVSVVIKSPNQNGKYTSKWKLVTNDGKKFGQALHVTFIVNDDENKIYQQQDKKIFKQQQKEFKKTIKRRKKRIKKRN